MGADAGGWVEVVEGGRGNFVQLFSIFSVKKEASVEREGNLTHTHRRRTCEGGTGSALKMLALKPAAVWPQAMGGPAKKLERRGGGFSATTSRGGTVLLSPSPLPSDTESGLLASRMVRE